MGASDPHAKRVSLALLPRTPFRLGALVSRIRFDDGAAIMLGSSALGKRQPRSLDSHRKIPQIPVPDQHGVSIGPLSVVVATVDPVRCTRAGAGLYLSTSAAIMSESVGKTSTSNGRKSVNDGQVGKIGMIVIGSLPPMMRNLAVPE